jgi:peptidoglycan/xylan/chitin deacetylase (PgdA/CDA1 family)
MASFLHLVVDARPNEAEDSARGLPCAAKSQVTRCLDTLGMTAWRPRFFSPSRLLDPHLPTPRLADFPTRVVGAAKRWYGRNPEPGRRRRVAGESVRRTMPGRGPKTTDRRRMLGWAAAGAASLLAAPIRRAVGQSAPPAPAPAPVPATVVGAPGVNIRACARVECPVRGVAKLGESLTVTGPAIDNFLPVRWGNVEGFAFDLYVATPDRTPELVQGQAGCNRVAILFDVGIGYPMQLDPLRWLKQNGIAATVFAMGWWAKANPDDLKQIAAMGFPIGSHGNERKNLPDRGDDEIKADIAGAADIIQSIIGEKPQPYFTPYAAAIDDRVRGLIARAGYLPVGWNVAADDWDFNVDPNQVFMKVVPNVTDGDLVEFHLDAPSTPQSTTVALPWIVDRLQKKGFTFVTAPEMAQPCEAKPTLTA